MKIKLMDGVRRNRANPNTFLIPSRAQKGLVVAGDYVKIGFIPRGGTTETVNGERMWVMVTRIEGRKYFGVLHNEPLAFFQKDLKYGDAVEFEARHIIDIIHTTGRA